MRTRFRASRNSKKQFTRTAMKTKKVNLTLHNSRGGICL